MAKIMLVEDDNNLREIYEARLLAEGYETVSARDGEEALALAVKEKPDLIIADIMMPKISGFDMLDILRTTPETRNTKVIMMTALGQSEDKERATKLGADRYLVKSQVTLEDVARVAHEVLEEGATKPETTDKSGATPAQSNSPAPAPQPQPSSDTTVSTTPASVATPVPSSQADASAGSTTPDPAAAATEPTKIPVSTPDDNTTASPATASDDPIQEQIARDEAAITEKLSQNAKTEEGAVESQINNFIHNQAELSKDAPAPAPQPQPSSSLGTVAQPTPAITGQANTAGSEAPKPQASVQPNNPPEADNQTTTVTSDMPVKPPPPDKDEVLANAANALEKEVPTNAVDEKHREKVIKPVNDIIKGPDLQALLAKEERNAPLVTPPTNTIIEPGASPTLTSGDTTAPSNGSSGDTGNTVDPNHIAL